MALIVFSHGNSFPASTYCVLLAHLREQGHTVVALEKFGHNPAYPVTSNWPFLVQELADFAQLAVTAHGQPAYFVGHSLGGFLSLMLACEYPHLARGLVLLDAPILDGWRAGLIGLAKWSGLIGRVSLGTVSRQRRASWDSEAGALAHFASKKIFASWDAQVLHDYVALCTRDDAAGQRVLCFEREVETKIYNTLPHHLGRLLRSKPLQCKAAFIGGQDSLEMQQVGLSLTRKVAQTRIHIIPGTHLFPMEHPRAAASSIAAALLSVQP